MFSRVQPSLLTPRLDADFYKIEFIENEAHLKEFGVKRLAKFIDIKASGYGVLPSSNEYCDDGVPLIRGGDLSYGEVVSPSVFAPLSYKDGKGTAIAGDILILIKGACIDGPEGVARVKQDNHGHLFNGSCFRLAFTDREVDGPFFIAYSQSKFFLRQKKRQVANTGISYNDEDSIHDYLIPVLENGVKKYIGDKVRKAEQLRAWAKRCRGKINDYFDGLFTGISLTKPEHHHTRVSLDILVPRLNAEYYSDHYTQVEKGLLDRFGKLTTLGRLAPTVRAKVKPAADCTYKEIGDLDVGKGAFSSGTFYKYGEAPNNAQRIFDEGDVAVSTRRPNRGAVAVIEESSSTTFYSVFLARLKPKNKNFGYWLKEFLRHDAGKLLLLQRCTWTTYPVISEDDIETIPVPEIPNDWDFVARLSRQSVELEAFATNLTTSAKTLVEALIEGQLTEQQLIQAQQALGDGDNSLDQAILSKLSNEGYAVEGAAPLFNDIDELYRLLESAAQAEAEE